MESPTCRSIGAVLALAVLVAALSTTVHAQHGPLAFTDGALYVGEGPTGRTLLLALYLGENGVAEGTLLEETPLRGEAAGLDLTFEGRYEREGQAMVVKARARPWTAPRTRADKGVAARTLIVRAPLGEDGARFGRQGPSLDPFATAMASFGEGPELELTGVGTVLASSTVLADGSLLVEHRAPFFYEDPWRTLDLASWGRTDQTTMLRQGLEQRHELPRAVSGIWWDRRHMKIEAFGDELVSFRVLTNVFTGGAHPNSYRLTRTLLTEGEGWRMVGLCEALAALDRPCDLEAIRKAVVRDLRRQEAAWVMDGEVDAETPWLLDLFTITPRGLRVRFDPYAVGPYAQGPFTVDLPFPLPAE